MSLPSLLVLSCGWTKKETLNQATVVIECIHLLFKMDLGSRIFAIVKLKGWENVEPSSTEDTEAHFLTLLHAAL